MTSTGRKRKLWPMRHWTVVMSRSLTSCPLKVSGSASTDDVLYLTLVFFAFIDMLYLFKGDGGSDFDLPAPGPAIGKPVPGAFKFS
jgi:hypothetical protein